MAAKTMRAPTTEEEWNRLCPEEQDALIASGWHPASRSKFNPDWTVHPGETLQEILDDRDITQAKLARLIGVSQKHINRVVRGKASITPTLAIHLERVLEHPSADFWVNHQGIHDLAVARKVLAWESDGQRLATPDEVPAS